MIDRFHFPWARGLGALAGLLTAAGLGAAPAQRYDHGDPTVYEQWMLELVNRARLDPAGEATRFGIDLNEGPPAETLGAEPRQPLAFNPLLFTCSRQHSQFMSDNGVFSHTGDGGSHPQDRMIQAGFVFSPPWSYGENLAWSGTTGPLDMSEAIPYNHQNLFVDEGIDGRGHRINLLNPSFREVGIGVLEAPFTQDGVVYHSAVITQDFGSTGAHPASFLLGVVYQDLDGDGAYTPGEGLGGVTVMPERGTFYAVTSSSGGYAIPLDDSIGTLAVTASQGPVAVPITKSVTLTGLNAKLDFETIADAPVAGPIRLATPRLLADSRVVIAVSGPVGRTLELQFSTDLVGWQAVQTAVLQASPTDLYDSPAASASRRFYRVVAR